MLLNKEVRFGLKKLARCRYFLKPGFSDKDTCFDICTIIVIVIILGVLLYIMPGFATR